MEKNKGLVGKLYYKRDLKIIGISDGAYVEQSSNLILTCDCSDNHEIDNIDWIWDTNIDSNHGLAYTFHRQILDDV